MKKAAARPRAGIAESSAREVCENRKRSIKLSLHFPQPGKSQLIAKERARFHSLSSLSPSRVEASGPRDRFQPMPYSEMRDFRNGQDYRIPFDTCEASAAERLRRFRVAERKEAGASNV